MYLKLKHGMYLSFFILILISTVFCFDEYWNHIKDVKKRYENGYFKEIHYYEKVLVKGIDNEVLVMKRKFYENGQIQIKENYKNGEMDGNCTWYHENGQIEKKDIYKDGKLIETTNY